MVSSGIKKLLFITLILLAYIPVFFIDAVNKSNVFIGSIPAIWVYMILWTLYTFMLLVIAYYIDRKL